MEKKFRERAEEMMTLSGEIAYSRIKTNFDINSIECYFLETNDEELKNIIGNDEVYEHEEELKIWFDELPEETKDYIARYWEITYEGSNFDMDECIDFPCFTYEELIQLVNEIDCQGDNYIDYETNCIAYNYVNAKLENYSNEVETKKEKERIEFYNDKFLKLYNRFYSYGDYHHSEMMCDCECESKNREEALKKFLNLIKDEDMNKFEDKFEYSIKNLIEESKKEF